MCLIFQLFVRKKKSHLQLFVYSLTTRCFMIYKTNQSFEFGCCQHQFFDDKFSISRIFTLENCISRILGEAFEKSHKQNSHNSNSHIQRTPCTYLFKINISFYFSENVVRLKVNVYLSFYVFNQSIQNWTIGNGQMLISNTMWPVLLSYLHY